MLTSIRERATGWIAWAIVILITIPFALWGVNSYFTGLTEVEVAEVDGAEIDYLDYQRALYAERDRVRSQLGTNASPELLSGSVLGRQVVERMINDLLLSRNAEDSGYRISDGQLARFIRAESTFQSEGQFDQALYERVLQFSGYSPSQFEGIQRVSAAVQQIHNGLSLSSLDLSSAVEQTLSLALHIRHGDYAIIRPQQFLSEIDITADMIQSEYDENSADYREPEKTRIQFLELQLENFATDYDPSEEELSRIYDAQTEEFLKEEQRSVSHVLIELSGDSENAEDDALALAQEVAEKARQGLDFSTLASEYSADAGSAQVGGSLGFINRGVTVPEFEAVAFSQEEGQISDPVRSQFGYHVIRVDEIRAEAIMTFEEARSDLIDAATRQAAETEMFEVIEEVRNVSYEQPETLEPVADSLGLELQISDWLTRESGAGVAAHAAVRQEAFSTQVLDDEFNSDVIEIDVDHFVVFRKYDYQASKLLPVEEVESEIREKLLVAISAEQSEALGLEIIDELNSDAEIDWNDLIADRGLESIALPSGDESADSITLELQSSVYANAKPDGNSVSYGGTGLSDGSYAVFRITDIVYGDIAELDDAQRSQASTLLNQRFGDALFTGHLTSLRNAANIVVHEDALSESGPDLY